MLQIERMNLMLWYWCRSLFANASESGPERFDLWPLFYQSSHINFENKIWATKDLYETCITKIFFPSPSLLFIAPLVDQLWFQDVAVPYKIIGVIDILVPKWSEMFKANLQPWFWLAIVMDNCSFFHTLNVRVILIAQAKHVPWRINWVNMTFKCNQSRW